MTKITISAALDGSITYFYNGVKQPLKNGEIVCDVGNVSFFADNLRDYVYTSENGLVHSPDIIAARVAAKRRCIEAFNSHRTMILNRYAFGDLIDTNPNAIGVVYHELSKYVTDFSSPTPVSDTVIGAVDKNIRHKARLSLYHKCKMLTLLFASAQNQKSEIISFIDRCPDATALKNMLFIPYEPKASALRWGY